MSNPEHDWRRDCGHSVGLVEHYGRPGNDFLLSALVTRIGPTDADAKQDLYSTTYHEVGGSPLLGCRRYELRLVPGEQDVSRFWSLTMYGFDGSAVEAPLDRYSIGDRTPGIQTDSKGGMTLVLQHERLDGHRSLNWVAAPHGEFSLVFRACAPAPSVGNPAWTPPAVWRVA